MANQSGIEWLEHPDGSKGLTVNPSIGCSRVSPGCGGGYIKGPNGEQGGCWAEELVSTRMSKNPKISMYADLARPGGGWSGIVKTVPSRLADIVALGRRKKGARVFVCDMSDMFHESVPFEFIAAIWGAMACAPNHLFYVLTKRPERALDFAAWLDERTMYVSGGNPRPWSTRFVLNECLSKAMGLDPVHGCLWHDQGWPLPQVAFGVTVEDRRFGVPRLDLARRFPARWRWASVEPLLQDLGDDLSLRGIDLAVVGAESGRGHRPFDVAWARRVRDVCDRDGARFFWKQGAGGDTNLSNAPADLRRRENLPI